ncbi:hypothetical protein [Rhodococcus rhodnii]|uniref:hypothetical protein n=1 Tax=Rhodococcus rhodnii TaxID=38312 RepID=UPI0009FA96B0|nr:hypothetical protein [Rhodococcus rhodnii]
MFRPPHAARDAAEFANTYLREQSVSEFLQQPQFAHILAAIPEDSWDVTAQKFRAAVGWDLKTSVIAASIAREHSKTDHNGKA